jgi:hypothetical protein
MKKEEIGNNENKVKSFSVLRPLLSASNFHEKYGGELSNYGAVHDSIQDLDVLIFSGYEKDQNSALSALLYGGAWQWTSPFALERYCSATNGDELAIGVCYEVTASINFFLQDESVCSFPSNDINIHNLNKFFCSTMPILVELFLLRKTLRYAVILYSEGSVGLIIFVLLQGA